MGTMNTETVRKVMDLLGESHDSSVGEALGISENVIQTERRQLFAQEINTAATPGECSRIAWRARDFLQEESTAHERAENMLARRLVAETTAMGCIAVYDESSRQELRQKALEKALLCSDVDLQVCHRVLAGRAVSEEQLEQVVTIGERIFAERLQACEDTYDCLKLLAHDNRCIPPTECMKERILVRAVSLIGRLSEYEAVRSKLQYEGELAEKLKTAMQEAIVRIEKKLAPKLAATMTFETCLELLKKSPNDFRQKVFAKMMLFAEAIPQWQQCLESTNHMEEEVKHTCIRAIAALIEKESVPA